MATSGQTDLKPCPFLPLGDLSLSAVSMRSAGSERGAGFDLLALTCAQSLWIQGLPAQAILLLNRAFSADLSGDEVVVKEWPLPYRAMRWIMEQRTGDQFIGNPRRHFQHLATRMVEPRRELRSWRAWACWAIAREVFPDDPADVEQLKKEGVTEPDAAEILAQLGRLGLPGEADVWREVVGGGGWLLACPGKGFLEALPTSETTDDIQPDFR